MRLMTEIGLRSSALLFASDRARARVVLGLGLAAALAGPVLGPRGWSALTVSLLLLLAIRAPADRRGEQSPDRVTPTSADE